MEDTEEEQGQPLWFSDALLAQKVYSSVQPGVNDVILMERPRR
jgi:hypothetical protein